MARVLVTGGTGTLGRELVPRLIAAGYTVRVMSRRSGESNAAGDVEWATADLVSSDGLTAALQGVDIVIHCASSAQKNMRETDIEGTRRLLEASKAGVSNLYYISIVGIDRIKYSYYNAKLAAEKLIEASGVPYTILRATQFHPLLGEIFLPMMKRGPFAFIPSAAKFQLIDAGEVAEHMVQSLAKGASSHLPDIGGPAVQPLSEIAAAWKKARGLSFVTVPVPAVSFLGALAKGYNCCPENKLGKITWQEWLAKRYP